MSNPAFTPPFDGAITTYFEDKAPKKIRKAIEHAGKDDILETDYP
ncbi:MAG: polyphosphate kinase 2, partial [Pseudomonadota bacterium]